MTTAGADPAPPRGLRLVTVNELSLHTSGWAIALVERSLAAGASPRLIIPGASGETRVYMSPTGP